MLPVVLMLLPMANKESKNVSPGKEEEDEVVVVEEEEEEEVVVVVVVAAAAAAASSSSWRLLMVRMSGRTVWIHIFNVCPNCCHGKWWMNRFASQLKLNQWISLMM